MVMRLIQNWKMHDNVWKQYICFGKWEDDVKSSNIADRWQISRLIEIMMHHTLSLLVISNEYAMLGVLENVLQTKPIWVLHVCSLSMNCDENC